jgi:hypothetical protein
LSPHTGSIYDQVLPEVYTDSAFPVKAKIASGRDESDFLRRRVSIVGDGDEGSRRR